jgi:hypothetical protein
MKLSRSLALSPASQYSIFLAGLLVVTASVLAAQIPPSTAPQRRSAASVPAPDCDPDLHDAPYIPVDSWVYPAVLRLYGLGFVDSAFLGMRPWTRASVRHFLEPADARLADAVPGPATDEAQSIDAALMREVSSDTQASCFADHVAIQVESAYSEARAISGTPLRDSFHLGQTIINDYGRPYANGVNNYTGASGYATAGRFLLYARGEFQGAPSATGYTSGLTSELAAIDLTTDYLNTTTPIPLSGQATIPFGPISSITNGRWMEAYVSARLLNHEISFGKQDDWLGPGLGSGMGYSNNAENVYSFRINRIEPLHVPGLSYITGPFRYEFLVGPLKGHVYPIDPWMHLEKVSFRPTENLEIGFQRTVIWGGKDHEPITLHTFLRSFFSTSAPNGAVKNSAQDPGARFAAFDFSYRLPLVRKWFTLYCDSEVHDDISPADAPRRSSWRPGIYLSHVPGIAKLDMRVEGASTDPPNSSSNSGRFMYWESIQRQGYTNSGQLFGDWMGREAKGGQGWITYHLSGNEWIQVGVRNQKAAKDFVPGGTTMNDINVQAVKRIGRDFEVNGSFAYEQWKAPIYPTGVPTYPASQHDVTTTTIQLTWYPQRQVSF